MGEYTHVPCATALLIALAWATMFSLASDPAIRWLRTLGMLSCYILFVVYGLVAGWKATLITWALFGVAGSLISILWVILTWLPSRATNKRSGLRQGQLLIGLFVWPLIGLFAWPSFVPEVVGYTLAELGIVGTPDLVPTSKHNCRDAALETELTPPEGGGANQNEPPAKA